MKSEVIVTNKKNLIERLSSLPDDAMVIIPAWGTSCFRASSKKYPNMESTVRHWFDKELFKYPDDTRGLMKLLYIPLFFIRKENAKDDFTEKAFTLADKGG